VFSHEAGSDIPVAEWAVLGGHDLS
jgi:hypothetical protein